MTQLDEAFDAYRDYTRRSHTVRRGHQWTKNWSNSPIQALGDWSHFHGLFMAEIPAAHRLPDVNPHLIDQLQLIWSRTHTSIDYRLRLIDHLYQNLSRPRQHLLDTLELSRLVTFDGDPRDGAPPQTAR